MKCDEYRMVQTIFFPLEFYCQSSFCVVPCGDFFVLSHLQTLDITAILQRILVANQQQILGQALRGISAEIFGGNYSNAMGHSTGQVMGHIVGALRNAFTKYL